MEEVSHPSWVNYICIMQGFIHIPHVSEYMYDNSSMKVYVYSSMVYELWVLELLATELYPSTFCSPDTFLLWEYHKLGFFQQKYSS